MFLLTSHGTVISRRREGGDIVHLSLRADDAECTPLEFEDFPTSVGADYKAFLELKEDTRNYNQGACAIPGLEIQRTKDLRTVNVTSSGFFMTALPGGNTAFHTREALGWEGYVPLSADELNQLRFILSNVWVDGASGDFIAPDTIKTREGWKLLFGSAVLDLRLQFPLLSRGLPFRIMALNDGWRIAQFFLYRPMLYFTAFNSPEVLKQLYLSLQSLLEFGHYEGAIHLITDQSRETILQNVPDLKPERLTIQTLHPADWVGYVAAKYVILENDAAYGYQPLLFNDPDIIFDSDVTPILKAISSSDRIAAPIEGGQLRTFPSMGAALYQRDGFDPGLASGFNAGTLGIPNLRDHGTTLELIRSIIVNHALLHGRAYHRWVDQEVANYVSFRVGRVNTHAISRYVRVGYPGTDKTAEGRCGLVHFWASHPKGAVMENYVRTLRAAGVT